MRMRQGYFLISFFVHAQKLVRQGYFFYIFFTLLTELCLLGLGLGGFFRLGFVGVGSTPFGCAVKSRPKVCYMTTNKPKGELFTVFAGTSKRSY